MGEWLGRHGSGAVAPDTSWRRSIPSRGQEDEAMTPWWNGSRCGATRRTLIARTIAVRLVARTPSASSFAGSGAGHGTAENLYPVRQKSSRWVCMNSS